MCTGSLGTLTEFREGVRERSVKTSLKALSWKTRSQEQTCAESRKRKKSRLGEGWVRSAAQVQCQGPGSGRQTQRERALVTQTDPGSQRGGGGFPAEGLAGGGLSPRRESCWEETQEQQSGLDLHSGRLSARGTEGDRGAVGTDSS